MIRVIGTRRAYTPVFVDRAGEGIAVGPWGVARPKGSPDTWIVHRFLYEDRSDFYHCALMRITASEFFLNKRRFIRFVPQRFVGNEIYLKSDVTSLVERSVALDSIIRWINAQHRGQWSMHLERFKGQGGSDGYVGFSFDDASFAAMFKLMWGDTVLP